jgi:hypothetical protein
MKFFVFLGIVVSLWYVMQWLQQAEANRRLRQNRGDQRASRTRPNSRMARATDTIVCSRCGAYVPADHPTACERNDCPFPGVG